jgi:hypothetical protein
MRDPAGNELACTLEELIRGGMGVKIEGIDFRRLKLHGISSHALSLVTQTGR